MSLGNALAIAAEDGEGVLEAGLEKHETDEDKSHG